MQKVITNLNDENFDKQALQMEEIAKLSATNPKNIIPLINEEVFTSLINIINKDTTGLKPATAEQIEARKKIIVNELVKKQSRANNVDTKDIELPFKLTDEEIKLAMELTPMELAERNKEYALYTIAMIIPDNLYSQRRMGIARITDNHKFILEHNIICEICLNIGRILRASLLILAAKPSGKLLGMFS